MQPPNAPPEWLTFLVMFVLVLLFIGFLYAVHYIKLGWRRLVGGATGEAGESGASRSRVRSAAAQRSPRSASVRHPIRRPDGTFAGSAGSGSRSEGSEVRPERSGDPPTTPAAQTAPVDDLPATADELAWTLEAVRLYMSKEEPTKEAAILRAFPHVTSKGGGSWMRASKLFDTLKQAQTYRASRPAAQTTEATPATVGANQ
jgi:hypothetical protein